MAQVALDFGVLGPLRVTADGAPVRLGTPKQRAVLALLVINRNRPVGLESLMAAGWAHDPPPGARASVHSYISNIRRMLDRAGGDGKKLLVSAPPGYQLSLPEGSLDLDRFIDERDAGVRAAAAGQFEQASTHLAAALDHWRGDVLDDLAEFAVFEAFAAALMEDKLQAITAHAEAEIACGRPSAVIGTLEALTAEHLYREPLWAQLITAYAAADRQADALAAYGRVKAALADELGVDPGPTLETLHGKVLRREPLAVRKAAKTTAVHTVVSVEQRATLRGRTAVAQLRDGSGRCHPLGAATRIGRRSDNDIVLSDVNVSRDHAVIIDTGTSFAVSDLGSANGVDVGRQRIRGSSPLADGDVIGICGHEFVFEIARSP